MFYREDKTGVPSPAEMREYINNPLWDGFCEYMEQNYHAKPLFEFSSCSWEFGWNVKFKKGSRPLCVVYPRENYFAVMIVVGRKEKDAFEEGLDSFCGEIQKIYRETKEGNGQKWLIIELEDDDKKYEDVKRILNLRAGGSL